MISTPYCTYFTVARQPDMQSNNIGTGSACVTNIDIDVNGTSCTGPGRREMMIVFVYDTEKLTHEDDDPIRALLYFYPNWVSDVQKIALCGQLMGTVTFLQATFGKPKVIGLQNGKFAVKLFGRFVLAIGSDRNIAQSLLLHRADLLASLLRLYHGDIETIHDKYSTVGQERNLSDRLTHIINSLLPCLQYKANIYNNILMLKMPKSASNIFSEAMHTLKSCQQTTDVLAGAILYHNKVLATQLRPKLTKNLILTDPSRVKTTGEIISVDFHVPNGCQLIVMYIPESDYDELKENIRRIELINTANTAAAEATFAANSNGASNTPAAFPFQFKKKMMKRDKSMVFTDIPEETATTSAMVGANGIGRPQTQRPNHLPLRFKNITSRDIPESGFSSSITFDEQDSYPQFYNRTSVCSTPMTENKVLHGNIMPICGTTAATEGGPWDAPIDVAKEADEKTNGSAVTDVPEPLSETVPMAAIADVSIYEKSITSNGTFTEYDIKQNTVDKPLSKRCQSYTDIRETLRTVSQDIANFTKGVRLDRSFYGEDHDDPHATEAADDEAQKYRTICDPFYPFFNRSGAPLSWDLFRTYMDKQRQQNLEFLESLDDKVINEMLTNATKEKKEALTTTLEATVVSLPPVKPPVVHALPPIKPLAPPTDFGGVKPKSRIGLSLPLRSCNSDKPPDQSTSASMFDAAKNRKLSGLQLTPLVSKLSLIAANDERSSGFSSWDATPGIELATPLDSIKLFRRPSAVKPDDNELIDFGEKVSRRESIDDDDIVMKRVELFICGQNNMTFYLLLEDNAREKRELVQKMFDVCKSKLPQLETSINRTIGINVGDKAHMDYCFLNLDPEWETLDSGGMWTNDDYALLEQLRGDFANNDSWNNFILRSTDAVIYGHQTADRGNVFFKQSSQFQNGLPPPADTIGSIASHAQRQLERDHSIILF